MGEIRGNGIVVTTVGDVEYDGRQRWRIRGADKVVDFYAHHDADHLVVLRLALAALVEQDATVVPFWRR